MQNIQVTKRDDSQVEIEGEISAVDFESYRKEVLAKLKETISVDGFRKGTAPDTVIEKQVGEMHILEDMAERAIGATYPKILVEQKIDAIGRPQITITKIAKDNPLGFKVLQAVMPEVKLPDVEKIAEKNRKNKKAIPAIEDKDVDAVLADIQKHRTKEGVAPLIDDELAKSLGEFKNLEDLKSKLKENLIREKELASKNEARMTLMDELITEANIAIPPVLVERQLDTLVEDFKSRVAGMGIKYEDYLKHSGKTEEQTRDGLRPDAKKRAAAELLITAIAEKFKIDVPKDDIDRETKTLLEMYKGADEHAARHYVEGMLRNERVFKFLESGTVEVSLASKSETEEK